MLEVPATFEEAREKSLKMEGAMSIVKATARLDPSTPTLETLKISTRFLRVAKQPLDDVVNVQSLATGLAHVSTTSAQAHRPPIRCEADGPMSYGRAIDGEPQQDDARAHDYG